MKISDILSEIDSKVLSTNTTSSMLIGYINNELTLANIPNLTRESTGAEAIAAVYRLPQDRQDIVFAKDFTPTRKKDSYKFTVLALAGMAVVTGLAFVGGISHLEGEAAIAAKDILTVLITGLVEIAKMFVAG